ncbi:MAG: hypothetical protein NZ805_01340 [Armatimonadetes bacterium]|nr:hypothetical protein [Armatimonadota bacterium]MDW8027443.1 hypothetical protein [Armatimonadota bacterium]
MWRKMSVCVTAIALKGRRYLAFSLRKVGMDSLRADKKSASHKI